MGSETVQEEHNEDLETDDLEIFLTELAEYYSEYELQPGEFTVNNVIARVDGECDRSRVTSDLHRRVKTGRLGKPPPDVIFYAHNHLFANSGLGNYPSQVFHLPAWQMGTSYTNKKPLSLSDIGGMTLLCDDGSYTWDLKRYKKNTSKMWKQTI